MPRILFALLILGVVYLAPTARAGDDPLAPLGSNLASVTDFSDEFPFINLMKSSRDWIPGRAGCFDCRDNPTCGGVCPVAIDRDADGYVQSLQPNQEIRSVIYAGDGLAIGHLPAGSYTMLFDGSGSVNFFGVSNVQNPQPGRITFDIGSSNTNIGFNITATTTGNHLRNIRILPPGGVCANDERRSCDSGNPCSGGSTCNLYTSPGIVDAQIFQPRFLVNAAPYRLLRLMDWTETNSSSVVNFADYPTPTSAFWHRVPPQILAELGNRLESDLWVNIPHRASNDFIDQFAVVLRDEFRPDRKLYVEYSNENWNGIFSQNLEIPRDACASFADLAAACQQDGVPGNGVACEVDPNTFNMPAPASSACFQALLRRWGDRSVEIFDRFDAVFGANARDRVVRVVAAQAANPDLGRQVLARTVTAGGNTVAAKTDAYAVAPYFGTEYCTPSAGINPDTHPAIYANINNFFADLQSRALPTAIGFMSGSKSMLTSNFAGSGIRLIAYEGGQHFAGIGGFSFNATCNSTFDAANADARMGLLYADYLAAWKQNGDEFAHFSNVGRWGPFGRWGALEFQDQATATSPKYTALIDFSAANPCWWPGCAQGPSAPIDALFADSFEGNSLPPATCTPLQLLSDGGLEASDPNTAANPFWASTSQNFGSAICTNGTCPDDAGTALPRNGSAWAWFGGIASAETSTLSQSVVIPSGTPRHLNFFLRRGFVSTPFDAVLRIRVDGTLLRTVDEPASAEAAYVSRTVDLSSFANGVSHLIQFEYVNPIGSGKSNFAVDDISVDCTAAGS
ncbi:MAG TPA: hypothetical protein PLQ74_01465 [Pseudomonadota bacterium]|nr:hypothetical protein [Xanthomonadales bacterium]HQW80517.1 hypothetical protein [Pseudomonadota bacterium]